MNHLFSKIRRRLTKKLLRLLSPRCCPRIQFASVWHSTSPSSTKRSSTRPRRLANSPRLPCRHASLPSTHLADVPQPIITTSRRLRKSHNATSPTSRRLRKSHNATSRDQLDWGRHVASPSSDHARSDFRARANARSLNVMFMLYFPFLSTQ